MYQWVDEPSGSSPWHCIHRESEQRRRQLINGDVRAELQCLRCGRSIRAVRASAPLESLPAWDDGIAEWFEAEAKRRSDAKRSGAAEEAARQRSESDREWWTRYNAHLMSDAWRALRRKVMERAAGRCEGCDERPAMDVHHLTYEHLGDEMLFELVAVCRQCHDRITAMDRARRLR